MALKRATYRNVRARMQPGDVIAFSGKGHFSEIIKWATRSSVSHVGIILQSKLLIDGKEQKGFFNQIIESTTLNGFSGVTISRLSDRVDKYDGEIWWLPLGKNVRKLFNGKEFFDFMLHQERKEYDMPQAIASALDLLDNVPLIGNATHNVEEFSRFFCSELATAGLEKAGAIRQVNSSEVTPVDLCMFNIFEQDYFQIKGSRRAIKGHNTLDPTGWGE
ncbi:MAG: hypothetical protein RRA94_03455 [Bacteroidota bacterium]|nr:hypothetical protein [Bacteroidota bacterium]